MLNCIKYSIVSIQTMPNNSNKIPFIALLNQYIKLNQSIDRGMSNRITQIFTSVVHNIDDDMQGFTPLKNICDQYKIKPSYVFVVVIVFSIILTLFGWFEHIFVTIFGMLYPAYMSFKAIDQNSQQKSKQWLTYWIVFGAFTAFDRILSIALFFLPGYYTFKVLFYLWMFYPRTNGAHLIYQKLLRPQLNQLKVMADKYHTQ